MPAGQGPVTLGRARVRARSERSCIRLFTRKLDLRFLMELARLHTDMPRVSNNEIIALGEAKQRAIQCEVLTREVRALELQVAHLQAPHLKVSFSSHHEEAASTASSSGAGPSRPSRPPDLSALSLQSENGLVRLLHGLLQPQRTNDSAFTPVSRRPPLRLVSENAAAAQIQAMWRMWYMRSRYVEFRVVAAVTGSELLPRATNTPFEALLCVDPAVCVFQVTVLHGQHARQVRHRYSDWLRLHERLRKQKDWDNSVGFPPKLPLPASTLVRRLREQQLHDWLEAVLLWSRRREHVPRDLLRFLTVDHLYWAYADNDPLRPGVSRADTTQLLRAITTPASRTSPPP